MTPRMELHWLAKINWQVPASPRGERHCSPWRRVPNPNRVFTMGGASFPRSSLSEVFLLCDCPPPKDMDVPELGLLFGFDFPPPKFIWPDTSVTSRQMIITALSTFNMMGFLAILSCSNQSYNTAELRAVLCL